MKGAFLLIAIVLIITLSRGEITPPSSFGQAFSAQGQNNLPDRIADQFSNFTVEWDLNSGIKFARQLQCVNPGYVPCASGVGCCPAGNNCVSGGCCPGGEQRCGSTKCYDPKISKCCADGSGACPLGFDCVGAGCCPSGQQPCGSSKCYDPKIDKCCQSGGQVWACPASAECCGVGFCFNSATQRCCQDGACPKEDSCCVNECCKPIAYCGSNGYCSGCPLVATETATATTDFTIRTTTTVTITETSKPPDNPDFTCAPLTVTNSANATLQLDTGCSLSFIPPSTTNNANPNPTTSSSNKALRPRQFSCLPTRTITTTMTITNTRTSLRTMTKTVLAKESESGFSCPPMTVTNKAGDELSLDESCALEFSPASTSNGVGSGSGSGNAPAQTSKNSAAEPRRRATAFVWGVVVVALLVIVM